MDDIVARQIINFLQFITIGVIIALIFDFFRAYRSRKKVKNLTVVIQDIVYFVIVTIIVVVSIVNLLDSNLRLYIFIAIIIGIMLYISLLSKFILKIYDLFFKILFGIIEIFVIPIRLILQIISKIYHFFEKYIKKCCKRIFNMISFIYKKVKKVKVPKIKLKTKQKKVS
ncbi:MAG: spore cortex biosynthesis protein YabQ [Clostridia bacterium]|nr:spore cortex biosynthesis protein YabQ [Clostridia bacterium]